MSFECQSCGASLMVEAQEKTARCPYCASPSVLSRPPSPDRPQPTFVLGFVVPHERALETARHWIRRPLFAPRAFRRTVPTEIRGLYAPAYLYSAAAHSEFHAEIGENYTVTETYTTTVNGRTVVRTRSRIETEWRPLSGRHGTYVSDRVVTASKGIPNDQLEAIEPFDLRALRRFSPEVISGWLAEEPSMPAANCVALARDEAVAAVGRMLAGFMPGDSHRQLRWRSWVEQEDLSLVLLPIWVLPVRYAQDKPPVRLLVNGQTGRLYGKAPVSVVKVIAAVGMGALLLASAVLAVVLAGQS